MQGRVSNEDSRSKTAGQSQSSAEGANLELRSQMNLSGKRTRIRSTLESLPSRDTDGVKLVGLTVWSVRWLIDKLRDDITGKPTN